MPEAKVFVMADEITKDPPLSLVFVQEGVKVEPVPCGKCGKLTVSRIESPDGQVGCLECLTDHLLRPERLPVSTLTETCWSDVCKEIRVFEDKLRKPPDE